METKRYFMATDGRIVVFRASDSRVYKSAWFTTSDTERGPIVVQLGFSAAPPPQGKYPAEELTKGDYDALVTLKNERLKASGRSATSPRNSWVTMAAWDQYMNMNDPLITG